MVNKILDGTLDGFSEKSGYWIYTDSFIAWVRTFQLQVQPLTKRHKLRLAASL